MKLSIFVMQLAQSTFTQACKEITQNLYEINNITSTLARQEIKRVCAKYSLTRIPRNHEILSQADPDAYESLRTVLIKKPIKTASGVAVVAVMPQPFACPHGRCTYCPGGAEINTPNSYTGKEPVTINAIEHMYDPIKQITSKIDRLISCGHNVAKLEIVIVGGTFLFMPKDYQEHFIKSCYDALNGFISITLNDAKINNEHANIRCVGFTIETKPDYCKQTHVNSMLEFGITRIEIGVQCLQERVYKIINRGHTYKDVVESFQVAKDSGYKLVAHMMPGLPTMSPKDDIADFDKLFSDELLKPDMLKIYPSLVLKDTPLYSDYTSGKYTPYSDDAMINVLATIKSKIPKWVRIMRIQREISQDEIIAGPTRGNLRQLIHQELRRNNKSCKCIRCREIGLQKTDISDITLNNIQYASSGGTETFLSCDDSQDRIYGFLRLRKPSKKTARPEINKDSCLVRELHVYGTSLQLDMHNKGVQHSGIGKTLLSEAEKIAVEQFDSKRLMIISAVGTRLYYKKLGYSLRGPYMEKIL